MAQVTVGISTLCFKGWDVLGEADRLRVRIYAQYWYEYARSILFHGDDIGCQMGHELYVGDIYNSYLQLHHVEINGAQL